MTPASLESLEDELLTIDLGFEAASSAREIEVLVGRLTALRSAVPACSSLAASITLREPIFERRLREAAGRERLANDPGLFEPHLTVARFARERFERVFKDRPHTAVLDLGALRELCRDLEAVVARANELGGHAIVPQLAEFEQTLALMRQAERPIAAAQRRLDPEAKEGWFGLLANQQFDTFNALIGSPPRPTARLALVDRIIAELERIRGEMRAYIPGSQMNQGNIAIVTERLAAYAGAREAVAAADAAHSSSARVSEVEAALDTICLALEKERAKHPALLETWATVPLIEKADELRRLLIEIEGPASPSVARASDVQHAAIDLHSHLVRVQTCSPPDFEEPTETTPVLQLAPGVTCTRAEALRSLQRTDAAPPTVQGELVDLGHAIACFANAGRRPELSHFAHGSVFRWLAPKAYNGLLAANALRGAPVLVHLFVRLAGSGPYDYLGAVTIESHGVRHRQPGVRVDMALAEPITVEQWQRYGGVTRVITIDGREHLYYDHQAGGLDSWLAPFLRRDSFKLEVTGFERAALHVHASGALVHVVLEDPQAEVPRVRLRARPNSDQPDEPFDRAQLAVVVAAFIRSGKVAPELLPPLSSPSSPVAQDAAIRELMHKIRANLELIVQRLASIGYQLACEEPLRPLSSEERDALARVEEYGPIPESLRAFWDIVGVVDLTQGASQLDTRLDAHMSPNAIGVLGHLGPLRIPPPGALMPHQSQRGHERREVAFFQEDCLKAGFSGDYVYLRLPNDSADFALRIGDQDHELFTDYLKRAVAWGGFRGHHCYEDHPEGKDAAGYVRPPIALIGGIVLGLEPM